MTRWVLRAAVAAAAAMLVPAVHAQSAPERDARTTFLEPTKPITTLSQWDFVIDALLKATWTTTEVARNPAASMPKDLPRLWDEQILTRTIKSRLDELHARAVKLSETGDQAALDKVIAEASPLLLDQQMRMIVLMGWMSVFQSTSYQRSVLEPWLSRAPPAEREAVEVQLAASATSLDSRVKELLARPGALQVQDLMRLPTAASEEGAKLRAKREALMAAQSALPNPIPLEPVTRTKPCPAPVAAPGTPIPGIGPGFPASESYYPAIAKRAGVEGDVTVKVDISATGCVERAEVVGSSGVKELDAGGLQLALDGSYHPASKDGQAVAGSMRFRVKFALH